MAIFGVENKQQSIEKNQRALPYLAQIFRGQTVIPVRVVRRDCLHESRIQFVENDPRQIGGDARFPMLALIAHQRMQRLAVMRRKKGVAPEQQHEKTEDVVG